MSINLYSVLITSFGYSFKTWDDDKSFADAPSILRYLHQATESVYKKDVVDTINLLRAFIENIDKHNWEVFGNREN